MQLRNNQCNSRSSTGAADVRECGASPTEYSLRFKSTGLWSSRASTASATQGVGRRGNEVHVGDRPRLSYLKGNGLPHPCRSRRWSDRVGVRGPRWNPTLRQNRAKGWGNLQSACDIMADVVATLGVKKGQAPWESFHRLNQWAFVWN